MTGIIRDDDYAITLDGIVTADGGKGSGWFKENGHIIKIIKKLSGAISGALSRKQSKEREEHAIKFFEEMRHTNADIPIIAKRSGLSIKEIKTIKNHIFFEKHPLWDGYRRFDPDYQMAQSWQRLKDNKMKLQPQDLIMLKHELLESKYMKNGYSYSEAHKMANKKYNYERMVKNI